MLLWLLLLLLSLTIVDSLLLLLVIELLHDILEIVLQLLCLVLIVSDLVFFYIDPGFIFRFLLVKLTLQGLNLFFKFAYNLLVLRVLVVSS